MISHRRVYGRIGAAIVVLASTLVACGRRDEPQTFQPKPGAKVHAVTLHEPAKLTSIETGKTDATGRALRAACVTCHTVKTQAPLPERAEDLKQFHVGLTFRHGPLVCASCHVAGHPEAVHLADGTQIPTSGAMQLCSQCHGTQRRSYDHGAHGGMSGYWDLSRGPRMRNNCVDCHDPHAPKYPAARPVLPPKDRLLEPAAPHAPLQEGDKVSRHE